MHESKAHVFEMLNEMREFINLRNHEAILLAEADVEVEKSQFFFKEKNGRQRMHHLFNFFSNKSLFLSLVRQNAEPIIKTLGQIQPIEGEWVNFLRTHDELKLDRLSQAEREEVFKALAPDPSMQIFKVGIRRRLAPMLKGDRKRIELINCAMFSLPGTPLLNYGEEIGMGDDLSLEGRNSLRTLMQWDGTKNAGFSLASSDQLAHPVIDFGAYHYEKVNVSIQQKDPYSFLNWMKRLISTRKYCPQLSFGNWTIISTKNKSVLTFYYKWKYNIVLIMLNFKNENCQVKIRIKDHKIENIYEIFSNQEYEDSVDFLNADVTLSAYGYRWFKGLIQ